MKYLDIFLISVGYILLSNADAQELVIKNYPDGLAKLDSGSNSNPLIKCMVDPEPTSANPTLTWINTGTNAPIPADTGVPFSVGVIRTSAAISLLFNGVKESHAGLYNCTGTINGQEKFKILRVEVIVKVELNDQNAPPNQVLTRGVNGKVACSPSGPSDTVVTWFKDALSPSNKINISALPRYTQHQDGGLVIKNVTESDEGLYICQAIADSSFGKQNIDVVVKWPPVITQAPVSQDATAGNSVMLECRADGKPPAQYEWFKDLQQNKLTGDRYIINEQTGDFQIKTVIKEDEGSYKCRASNFIGQPAEKSATLTVSVKPGVRDMTDVTSDETGTATLTCRATGDPVPSIVWEKEGSSGAFTEGTQDGNENIGVTNSEETEGQEKIAVSTLSIQNLQASNKGTYKCKAKNRAGEDLKSVKLIVQYTPDFKDQPYTTKFTWAGQRGEILCIANGVPLPDIHWFKNTTELGVEGSILSTYSKKQEKTGEEQVTGTLTTGPIDFGNIDQIVGTYKCEARNVIQTSVKEITLRKADSPPMPTVSMMANTPTKVTFQVTSSVTAQQGPPVENVRVTYYETSNSAKKDVKSVPVDVNGAAEVVVDGLTPNSNYVFMILAESAAGSSDEFQQVHTTLPARKPYDIYITSRPIDGQFANRYRLRWTKPDNGGAPITAINIKHRKVTVRDEKNNENLYQFKKELTGWTLLPALPGNTLTKDVTNLEPLTYYEVEVQATNTHGTSNPQAFIFKTGKGAGGLGIGAIIGIVIVVFIILFIIVDVTCYFRNRCGVLMCIRDKLGGSTDGDTRSKEAKMEDGDEETAKMLPKDNEPTVVAQDDTSDKRSELEPEDKEEEIMELEKKASTPDEKPDDEKTGIQETEAKTPEADSKPPEPEAEEPVTESGDTAKAETPKEETTESKKEDGDAQQQEASA